MTSRRKKVAIFDVDGTIFRSSLLIEVTEALIDAGIFPPAVRRRYARQYAKWLDRDGSYEEYVDAVVQEFARNIKGVHYRVFSKIASGVIARHKNRTYRYTRNLVEELKRKGYYLIAISKSPKGIVQGFAKSLGFNKIYGFLYETGKTGKYTGNLLYIDLMSDKSRILLRAIEKEGLTLAGSIGVGDTESDIPFLTLVTKPICFNPNRKLYAHARKSNWKVVVERKDVIYEI